MLVVRFIFLWIYGSWGFHFVNDFISISKLLASSFLAHAVCALIIWMNYCMEVLYLLLNGYSVFLDCWTMCLTHRLVILSFLSKMFSVSHTGCTSHLSDFGSICTSSLHRCSTYCAPPNILFPCYVYHHYFLVHASILWSAFSPRNRFLLIYVWFLPYIITTFWRRSYTSMCECLKNNYKRPRLQWE